MPEVIVIGGANGAGKSTFARYVLPVEMPFLNADEIAKTLPRDFAGNAEIEAGRQLLRRMDEFAVAGQSFAIETTLASRSLAPRLRELQTTGNRIALFYIWVPAPELSVERVAARVRKGGHNIPTETIHRRYWAGLHNLFRVYLPLAERWRIYLNAEMQLPRVVASQGAGHRRYRYDSATWSTIQEQEKKHER